MRYMKLMPGKSIINASRNRRELSVAHEMGYSIIVVSRDGEELKEGELSSYRFIKDGITMLNNNIPRIKRYITILLDNYKLIKKIIEIDKEAISCHDLTALFLGYISTLARRKKRRPKLIYDSHEFEIGRNTKRNVLKKWLIIHLERFLIKRCMFSIMVNDSIADEVQRIHNLKQRPVVVRSTPNYWVLDESICAKRKRELCEQLGVGEDTFLVMYHGKIMSGRGIETLLMSIKKSDNVIAVVLGDGAETYIRDLEQKTAELGISERVLFHKAVPIDILWQYVGAANVGMITIPAVSMSYYYMLPNKLFENIQSLTPIIGSDFPEIKRIIKGYDIGICVDPESIDEISNAIEEMRTNKDMYSRFKKNLIRAKEELCWEKESKVLKEAYEITLG